MADEDRLVDADVIADYLGVERKVVLRLFVINSSQPSGYPAK